MKRKNKNKKEIVSSIQLNQDADRRRALIKEVLYPFLVEMGDTIGYSSIFLQSFSAIVEGVFEEQSIITTIGHITPRLKEKLAEIFNVKDPQQKKEYDRYVKLIDKLHDISIRDFTYAKELTRYVDGFYSAQKNKQSFSDITPDILNKIMG